MGNSFIAGSVESKSDYSGPSDDAVRGEEPDEGER
jgi:hypothetical protein